MPGASQYLRGWRTVKRPFFADLSLTPPAKALVITHSFQKEQFNPPNTRKDAKARQIPSIPAPPLGMSRWSQPGSHYPSSVARSAHRPRFGTVGAPGWPGSGKTVVGLIEFVLSLPLSYHWLSNGQAMALVGPEQTFSIARFLEWRTFVLTPPRSRPRARRSTLRSLT